MTSFPFLAPQAGPEAGADAAQAGAGEPLFESLVQDNSGQDWLLFGAIAVGVLLALVLLRGLFIHRLAQVAERTHNDLDDFFVDLMRRTRRFFLLAIAVYAAAHALSMSATLHGYLSKVLVILGLVQIGIWAQCLVFYLIQRTMRSRAEDDPGRTMGSSVLTFVGRVVVWTTVLLLALDNAGVDVTALITGLGVSGIAVALALQNVLGDLFASIAILLDKPFVVGDFIVLGDFMGNVERIGIKTTRLRSLSGEEIVIGNNDLVSSRVRNFKRMNERRKVFSVGVTYDTPVDKLEAIPGWISEIVKGQPQARLDRAHFAAFGDFSLNFEVVYWVLKPDYAVMMDTQQAINLAIARRFEEQGVEFAFPTQTLHLVGPAAQKELSRG